MVSSNGLALPHTRRTGAKEHVGRRRRIRADEERLQRTDGTIEYVRARRFRVRDTGLDRLALVEDIGHRAGFEAEHPRDADGQHRWREGAVLWIALGQGYHQVRIASTYRAYGRLQYTLAFVDHAGVEIEDVLEAQLTRLVCVQAVAALAINLGVNP